MRFPLYRRKGGPQADMTGCKKLDPTKILFCLLGSSSCSLFDLFHTCFFALIVLACSFFFTTHNTNTSMPLAGFFYSLVLCLYLIRSFFFVLIILRFAFCLLTYTTTQTSMPPADFEPQPQQASGYRRTP
jgi:cellulose synthase/poly-beta-1,6-N-acetylglucosamine synthase-like glycosyltransferase